MSFDRAQRLRQRKEAEVRATRCRGKQMPWRWSRERPALIWAVDEAGRCREVLEKVQVEARDD